MPLNTFQILQLPFVRSVFDMAQKWIGVFLFLSVFLSVIITYTSGALPCEDHHPRCGHWASTGECKKNVKWMSKHCRISCGLCAQANVHDLYNQARMERYGAIKLLIGLIIIVVVGVFTKIYFEGPSCPSSAKLTGKTVVITGGNTGIGKETARILAWRRARVIIGCRDITKGLQAAAEIIENTGNRNVEVKKLDLSSFKSVRKFAEEVNEEEGRVDVLINNAGYFGPYLSTVDGLENTIQVNYLSHFLLSHLLLDKLKACSPSRIVNVSSRQHVQVSQIDISKVLSQKEEDYGLFKVYSNSKLCQVLSTIEMSKKLKGSGVTVNALHPGVVRTEIIRNFRLLQMWILRPVVWFVMYFFFKTPNGGAQTSVYCAVAEELKNVSGEYFKDCALTECSALARDEALATELWKQSEELTGINRH